MRGGWRPGLKPYQPVRWGHGSNRRWQWMERKMCAQVRWRKPRMLQQEGVCGHRRPNARRPQASGGTNIPWNLPRGSELWECTDRTEEHLAHSRYLMNVCWVEAAPTGWEGSGLSGRFSFASTLLYSRPFSSWAFLDLTVCQALDLMLYLQYRLLFAQQLCESLRRQETRTIRLAQSEERAT